MKNLFLLPATLGLIVVSALAATSINHYQSATANGVSMNSKLSWDDFDRPLALANAYV